MASTGPTNKTSVLRYTPNRGMVSDDWTDPDDFRGNDTVQFFCDGEAANDSGTGLSSASPKKTTPAIMAVYRAQQASAPGRPDQILFKTSDTATYAAIGILTASGSAGSAPLDGRSSSQRVVFGTYGVAARAVFTAGSTTPIQTPTNGGSSPNGIKNIAILGFEFNVTGSPSQNILIDGSIENFLVENCKFKAGTWGITMGVASPFIRKEITIRRNVFVDAAKNFIRLIGTDGVLIEENYFDGIAVQTGGTNNVNFLHAKAIEGWNGAVNTEVRGNTFTNYGYCAIWLSSGGIVYGNVVVNGCRGIQLGNSYGTHEQSYPFGTLAADPGGMSLCQVEGNYVGEGKDITAVNGNIYKGAVGIYIQNVSSNATPRSRVWNNIVTKSTGTFLNYAFYINGTGTNGAGLACGVYNITFQGNKVYRWYSSGAPVGQIGFEFGGWNINGQDLMFYDVDFIDNEVDEFLAPIGPLVRLDSSILPQFESAMNDFDRAGPSGTMFRIGGSDLNMSGYLTTTGDTSSRTRTFNYPAPDQMLADYYSFLISGSATLADYVTVVRLMSRLTWNNDLMAEKSLNYFHNCFA